MRDGAGARAAQGASRRGVRDARPRRAEAEIDTTRYFGGAIIPDHGGLHPGLYHQGLLKRAKGAGADIRGQTPVTAITGDGGRFEVATKHGTVLARDVLIATNGYTSGLMPWLDRRVIPFDGYMIATEPLPEELAAKLLPGGGRSSTGTSMSISCGGRRTTRAASCSAG